MGRGDRSEWEIVGTSTWDQAYDRIAGTSGEESLGAKLRRRRWAMLMDRFPDLASMRVLDLGGTTQSWELAPVKPAHVTLLNMGLSEVETPDWMRQLAGDACDVPDPIRSEDWDLVFSNSVIEHVGGYAKRAEFAEQVRSLAPAYWVQTPNRYFPVEPHWLFPGFQFLPVAARRTVAQRWPLYRWRSDDRERALREVLEIELVSKTEMAHLFPDAELLPEKVVGLTKSWIAVRRSG